MPFEIIFSLIRNVCHKSLSMGLCLTRDEMSDNRTKSDNRVDERDVDSSEDNNQTIVAFNRQMNTLKISEEVMRSKSSFDRFGDDLTEVILSYLPFDNKFRFECLSKQIQSLIYSKQ